MLAYIMGFISVSIPVWAWYFYAMAVRLIIIWTLMCPALLVLRYLIKSSSQIKELYMSTIRFSLFAFAYIYYSWRVACTVVIMLVCAEFHDTIFERVRYWSVRFVNRHKLPVRGI
ncbi:hypothetical protein GGR50DRAFT_646689 [Xylaria sp. CBS 124048]|nr:hypothetical protein GGR50DRAFT_646689 [Xylaria sp. CBS 124048]